MNIDFSPKKQFQSHDALRKELQTVVVSDNFHESLSYAMSEFVTRFNPSAEQISAVKLFISTLLNLPAEDNPMPQLPVHRLNYSVLEPRQPPK